MYVERFGRWHWHPEQESETENNSICPQVKHREISFKLLTRLPLDRRAIEGWSDFISKLSIQIRAMKPSYASIISPSYTGINHFSLCQHPHCKPPEPFPRPKKHSHLHSQSGQGLHQLFSIPITSTIEPGDPTRKPIIRDHERFFQAVVTVTVTAWRRRFCYRSAYQIFSPRSHRLLQDRNAIVKASQRDLFRNTNNTIRLLEGECRYS